VQGHQKSCLSWQGAEASIDGAKELRARQERWAVNGRGTRCRRRRRSGSRGSEGVGQHRATPLTSRYEYAYCDSLIDSMVGAQGDVGARGLGQFAGRSRRSQSRRRNRQLTYYVCTDEGAAVCCECAESHYCSEGRGELDSLWLRARRPFSLAGWGLHLAHSGINNPNHYIGRAHAVWAGQTPQRCTVSLFPGRVPSRAMLARPVQRARCCEDAAAMGVSLSVHLSIHHTSRINIKVSLSRSKANLHLQTFPFPPMTTSVRLLLSRLDL
jgi:hypothetical protein